MLGALLRAAGAHAARLLRAADERGWSALHHAAHGGHARAARALLDAASAGGAGSVSAAELLSAADARGAEAWVDEFVQWGVSPDEVTFNTLAAACARARLPAAAEAALRRCTAAGLAPSGRLVPSGRLAVSREAAAGVSVVHNHSNSNSSTSTNVVNNSNATNNSGNRGRSLSTVTSIVVL